MSENVGQGHADEDGEEWIKIEDPFARRLIETYLSRRNEDIAIMRTALGVGELDLVRVKGHNLIGSGSAYGLNKISELGRLIEAAVRLEDKKEISIQISNLEKYIRSVRIL